ncbi:helix-turn-helix domain-containing protein [Gordonibacter massiliensis (ex Traore et al. 2017)]|uniref:helix-turn-helix domain-containing protein n=1 Tax=Gordonibacter massiliensis (ex Traore et al. 2017) TaxID=1841863 RepID=UPI00349FF7B2
MNEIYRHILTTVESKRVLLGMSKAELARRMEIDPVTLGTMLRGQRSMYADEAMKLCVYLDIDPSELLSPELRRVHLERWGPRKRGSSRDNRA